MAATLPDVTQLAETLGFAPDAYRNFFSSRLYQGVLNQRDLFVAGPFIGAPHAAILLENLAVRGVSSVIFTGWCGSLVEPLAIGDILLASGAFSDEGTSRHYGVPDANVPIETSLELNAMASDAMNHLGLEVKKAPVWTTDALYRETPSKIKHFRDKGAWAVEMELSALLSVAGFRGLRLGSLLLVSDDVSGGVWNPGFKNPRFKKGRKTLCDIVKTLTERICHG